MEERTYQGRTVYSLTTEERAELVRAVDSEYRANGSGEPHPVRVTVRALLHTGLRSAELAHLPPGRVYEKDGLPTVRVAPVDCSCSYCRKQAKLNAERRNTGAGDAEVDRATRDILDAMWKPKSAAGEREVTVYDDDTHEMLRDTDHFGVTPSTVYNRVKRAEELVELKRPLTPHVLRHSMATMLAEAGVGIKSIADDLGHVSSETTNIYVQESYVSRARRNRDMVLGP
jgi:integrase